MGSLSRLADMLGYTGEEDDLLREYAEHEQAAAREAAKLAEKKDEPPPLDMHSHQCSNCYHLWRHSGRRASRASKEEMKKMHSCPKCGTEEWIRYVYRRSRWS